MKEHKKIFQQPWFLFSVSLTVLISYLLSHYNYLLFHTAGELLSIITAAGIFIIAWNTRQIANNSYLLFLGTGYAFVAFIDLFHTLAYKGMPIFNGYGTDLPTQLWIAARYLQAFVLLFAPFTIRRKLHIYKTFGAYMGISSLLLISIFTRTFPACFTEGSGLTTFKVFSEYAISLLLVAAFVIHRRRRRELGTQLLRYVLASIVLTIVQELLFTLYIDVYGISNFLGHVLKIISCLLLYKAVIRTGLQKPYELLFRDLKHHETQLQQSEATARALLNTPRDAIFLIDPNGTVLDLNEAFAARFHTQIEKLRGSNAYDLLPEKLARSRKAHLDELLRTGKPVNFIDEYQGIWNDNSLFPICDALGAVTHIVIQTHNITKEKRREEQFRKLSTAVEQSPSMLLITDAHANIEYVNPKFSQITGYRMEEVLGKNPSLLKSGQHSQHFYQQLWETINTGRDWHGELYNQKKNGDMYWEFASIAAIKDADGAITHWVKVAEDITERKRTEEELQKSEAQLRSIFDSSPNSIVVTDLEGTIKRCNQRSLEIHGCASKEDILGKNVLNFVAQQEWDRVAKNTEKTLKQGWVRHVEYLLRKHTGHTFFGELSASVISDDSGAPLGFVGITRDITPHKQTLEQLDQARKEAELAKKIAENANRAKSQFVANMSHELRTPLNGILGYTQLLKRDKQLTAKQQRAIETMQRSGEHLLHLINDILDISKIETDKLALELTEFSLPSSLATIIALIRVQAQQKGLTLRSEQSPDLPHVVYGDEKRLRQVLLNLLGNSLKFTRTGSVTLRVTRKGDRRSGDEKPSTQRPVKIHFEVEDTGIGIPKSDLQAIFEPFHQLDTKKLHAEGTGLGLTISRSLVQKMGGNLDVHSCPGKGSLFRFEIDVQEIMIDPSTELIPPSTIIGFKGEKKKVLCVDDTKDNRDVVQDMLGPLGFEILEAQNGQTALQMAQKELPDLILMDLMMSELDGFETTRRMREMPALKNVPIIAMSANVFASTRQKSLCAGCDDFLPKPLRLEQVLDLLEKHLHLEWSYETAHRTLSFSTDKEIIAPPREELAQLDKFSKIGDIIALRTWAASTIEHDERLAPFAQKIFQLVEEFEIINIQKFIDSYR